ncbi:MAG: thiamine pyrophosphate-requiring protein [Proteobacteria bacterium]|nr:thiamine pyrophosphate-requiring protein [Pseudomonadota bacterium]MDA1301360.1 thiamine pyrophosphate-requiring protein [Pseudomonadota bacterium]
MNGFDLIAKCLKAEGVTWLSCFPNNPLIESAAKVGIRPIVFRQERGAINAADGYARTMRGKVPGVYASQSGPGVENSFGGIAQAWGEAVPMVFFPLGHGLKGYDVKPNFSAIKNYEHITKEALSIDRPDRITTQVQRAFHSVKHGRPGPSLVEMHGDVCGRDVPEHAMNYKPTKRFRSAPSAGDVKDAVKALLGAKRPVIWAGQGVLYADGCDEVRQLAELTQIPVITTMEGKSILPDSHPLALGSANRTAPRNVFKWLGESDVVLCVGSGLTRTTFGIDIPDGKTLIHSTVSPEDLNKDYTVDIGLIGDAKLTLEMLIEEVKASIGEKGRDKNQALHDEIAKGHADWLKEWEPLLNSTETPINPYRVINEINKVIDHKNSIVTHDAGNPRDQIMPFYKATDPAGYIGWGKTTHLGYGIPLMIGAKLADPSKFCMNFMGDLAFGHTGLDIETAVRAEVPITTVVINNYTMGGYDAYMPTAMKEFGAGNQTGEYAEVGKALGAHGIKVTDPAGIGPALEEAQRQNKEGKTCVVEIITRQDTRFSWYNDMLKPA